MKWSIVRTGMKRCLLLGTVAFVMGVSAVARADLLVPTLTGADLSVPSTIGTFSFTLPDNSVITRVILFSPEYAYTSAPSPFVLEWRLDVPTFSLPLPAGYGTFFLGTVVPDDLYAQIADGSVTLSVVCDSYSAPCPTTFTRTDSQDWRLWIEYTPPPTRPVDIDVRPGTMPNPVNPQSGGVIPVAVLSDQTFYAPTEVALGSLTFGRLGTEASLFKCNAQPEDVNADGLLDLVCHFSAAKTGFVKTDTQGVLMGVTVGGVNIKGADSVRVVR